MPVPFRLQQWCCALALAAGASATQAAPAAPDPLVFRFDFAFAQEASLAMKDGEIDAQEAERIVKLPAAAAMVRKLKLKDSNALIEFLRKQAAGAKTKEAAAIVAAEFSRTDGGGYAQVAAEVTQMLKQYVPAQFSAKLNVYFIFGGSSGGFAFDDNADDVYVNLARFSKATSTDLAETVAHELFHAVQSHVMSSPPRPAPGAAQAATGPVWMNRLLYDLLQEGTAELLTHPVANRPASAHSARNVARIERNMGRMSGLMTLLETTAFRLLHTPPRDEDQYDGIYGLLFYGDYDEPAYDIGWTMASAIEKNDGRPAIFALLRSPPKQFILRYQQLAAADRALPRFSDEFIAAVRALGPESQPAKPPAHN